VQYIVDKHSADWTKQLRSMPVLSSRPLQDWVCLYPYTKKNSAEVQEFIAHTERVSRGLGIHWTRPRLFVLLFAFKLSFILPSLLFESFLH